MREIIFRGKTTLEGMWIYGDLYQFLDGHKCIVDSEKDWYRVVPETVGQYTGLKDKNGKQIFEGDILLINNEKHYPVYVVFVDFRFNCRSKAYKMYRHTLENNPGKYEVIGNIHDHPAGGKNETD